MKTENFEKFYYAKVGLGEGCGCAERIIDVHEFERLAGRSKRLPRLGKADFVRSFKRFFGITKPRGPLKQPDTPIS